MRFNKIFGIGLPRTGTTSLHIALMTLGISSIHFPFSLYEAQNWTILNQYTAFVDTPIPMFYKKLDQLLPDSGFILTTRPLEDWLNSMEWLLTEGAKIWGRTPKRDKYKKEFFGSEEFDSELYRARYCSFHDEVKQYFAVQDNLLVLDLGQRYGYKEICQFLEIPIYQEEYPRGNQSRHATFLQRIAYQAGKHNRSVEKLVRYLDRYSRRAMQHFK